MEVEIASSGVVGVILLVGFVVWLIAGVSSSSGYLRDSLRKELLMLLDNQEVLDNG